MNILCIETSGINCSVALAQQTQIKSIEFNNGEFAHGEKLHLLIEELLESNNICPKDLDAVAVSKGPGSYTGLRIGYATAKGICFALSLPLLAIDSLNTLSREIKVEERQVIVPILDARRMEVFCSVVSNSYITIKEPFSKILTEDSFSDLLSVSKVHFIGDGVEKTSKVIGHPNAVFHKGHFPSAKSMAYKAIEKMKNKDFEDLAYCTPNYVKDWMPNK